MRVLTLRGMSDSLPLPPGVPPAPPAAPPVPSFDEGPAGGASPPAANGNGNGGAPLPPNLAAAAPTPTPISNERISPATLRKMVVSAGVTDVLEMQFVESLVENNKLRATDIDAFVRDASEHGQTLSVAAVLTGLTTDEDVVNINAAMYGMEPVILRNTEVDDEIVLLIKPEQAEDWGVLPYARDELGRLLVAITNPRSLEAREGIQSMYPREEIIWRFASADDLHSTLKTIYQEAGVDVAEAVSDIAADLAETSNESYVVRDSSIEAPVIKLVDSIIARADKLGASDIHIEPKERSTKVRFRVDSMLQEGMKDIPAGDTTRQVVARIKTLARMRTDERRKPQDGRVTVGLTDKTLDLRVVTVPTIYGEQVTMRLLDQEKAMLSLEKLGMTENNLKRYGEAIQMPWGCALITGPTGSGKSTTLYSSAVRVVTPEKKFISIEDPVEYRLPGISQIDVSGQGEGAITFATALTAIMRSDPDIVMVGEIRDRETAATAVDAALTGHFLYSTLHTNNALASFVRLERMGIEPFLIGEAVAVIVAQRLVRLLCEECRMPQPVGADYLKGIRAPKWAVDHATQNGQLILFRAREDGCAACGGKGYKGRTGVHEVIKMTEELREALASGQAENIPALEKIVRGQGMHSLYEDTFIKVVNGLTSLEEMARAVAVTEGGVNNSESE